MDLLSRLASREALLGIGMTLVMLGVILRGLARSHRRTLAARKQHELDVRAPGAPIPEPPHFERHLGSYANGLLVLGVVLTVVGFTR